MSAFLIVLMLIQIIQLNSVETSSSCSVIMSIDKQGFHRKLTTSLLVMLPPESTSMNSQCMAILEEVFPTGAYVDPYEIHRMKEIQIAFQSEVNLEKPESLSPPQTFLVYLPLKPTTKPHYLKAEVILPFHLRYHQPKIGIDNNFATINIDSPTQVFTNCSDGLGTQKKLPCSSSDSSLCLWQKLKCKTVTVTANVPVGNLNHLLPVSVITILSTLGSSALLLHKMYKQNIK